MFNICFSCVIPEPSGFIILIALTLLMRIVMSFVWRKFSSVGGEEWCDEMNYGQKLKLGDAHGTPRNIQEVQASKLGDAPKHPHFHHQNIRSSLNALHFLLLLTICVILGASLFLFSVLFCFVLSNKWLDPIIFVLERDTLRFNCIEHSSFHFYVLRVFYFCEYCV